MRTFLVLWFLLGCTSLRAIKVNARFRPSTVQAGEATYYEVTVVGTDSLPDFEPILPASFVETSADDYYTLRTGSPGENGRWAQLVWKTFPLEAGQFRIGEQRLVVDEMEYSTPMAELTVRPSSPANLADLELHVILPDESLYPGQTFEAFVELSVPAALSVMLPWRPILTTGAASRGAFGDFSQVPSSVSSPQRKRFRWPVTMQPFRAGPLEIGARLPLRLGREPAADQPIGYGSHNYFDCLVNAGTATITIAQLPVPPEGFAGVIGEWKLSDSLLEDNVEWGEGFIWDLFLTGDGFLPSEPPIRFVGTERWSVSPPLVTREGERVRFRYHLQPDESGWWNLPRARLLSFSPSLGDYREQTLGGHAVVVQKGDERGEDAFASSPETQFSFGGFEAWFTGPVVIGLVGGLAVVLILWRVLRSLLG